MNENESVDVEFLAIRIKHLEKAVSNLLIYQEQSQSESVDSDDRVAELETLLEMADARNNRLVSEVNVLQEEVDSLREQVYLEENPGSQWKVSYRNTDRIEYTRGNVHESLIVWKNVPRATLWIEGNAIWANRISLATEREMLDEAAVKIATFESLGGIDIND